MVTGGDVYKRQATVRAQDAQNIFRCGQLRQRVMDKEALAVVVIIVGVIRCV